MGTGGVGPPVAWALHWLLGFCSEPPFTVWGLEIWGPLGRTDRSPRRVSIFIDVTVRLGAGSLPPMRACSLASARGGPGGRGSGAALTPHTPQHRLNPVHIEGNPREEVGVLAVGTLANQEGVHGLEDAVADQGAARVALGRWGQAGQSPGCGYCQVEGSWWQPNAI